MDASHRALETVRDELSSLDEGELAGIRARDLLYDIIGAVELTVISMYRAISMASQLQKHFAISTPFPASVASKLPKLKAIRDAYEHIDERARGLVQREPHPDALSVFEFERLFRDRVVSYASQALDLEAEATQPFAEVREYLKTAVGELSEVSRTTD